MPADSGVFFHQIGLMTGIADVQSGLHAGNAPANNENIRMNRYLPGLEFVMMTDTVDGSGSQSFGFAGGLILAFRHPGNLFPDRSHLKHVRIEPGTLTGALKSFLVQPGRAGSHHHPI